MRTSHTCCGQWRVGWCASPEQMRNHVAAIVNAAGASRDCIKVLTSPLPLHGENLRVSGKQHSLFSYKVAVNLLLNSIWWENILSVKLLPSKLSVNGHRVFKRVLVEIKSCIHMLLISSDAVYLCIVSWVFYIILFGLKY